MICGKSEDVPVEKVDECFKNLPNLIDGYKQRDIYNVDERDLFIISCLEELSHSKNNCSSRKNSKDCLTDLFCTNDDGNGKRTPIVKGKS